jgi:hypothetical protein
VHLRRVRSGNTFGVNDSGVMFQPTGPATLHVTDSVFYDNSTAGIFFSPSSFAKLVVTDSSFIKNGNGASGAGILIKPQPGGAAQVHLQRVSAEGNVFGIVADGTGSTGGINATIADSVVTANSQDGIIATTPGAGAPIGLLVSNTRSTNNAIGIRSVGNGVAVRVKNSEVVGNNTGLVFGNSGALLTAGNNIVEANGSNGGFSGAIGLK